MQKILKDAAVEVGNESRRMADELDGKNLEFLKKYMAVNEVDKEAFKKASLPIYQELGKSVGEDLLRRFKNQLNDSFILK